MRAPYAGPFQYVSATIATAMEPAPPVRPTELATLPDRLSPYGLWLHVALALRDIRTSRWWARGGGRRYVGGLLSQRGRIRRAGWFN